jgi:adenylate cyclase
MSLLLSADTEHYAEDNNWTINRTVSAATDLYFRDMNFQVSLFLRDEIKQNKVNSIESRRFFDTHKDFFAVSLTGLDGKTKSLFTNNNFPDKLIVGNSSQIINTVLADNDLMNGAINGSVLVRNVTQVFNMPMLVMVFPWTEEEGLYILGVAYVFFTLDSLAEIFHGGILDVQTDNVSFMINSGGDVLIHPNKFLIDTAANFSSFDYIKNIMTNNNIRMQTIYSDENGDRYIGAFEASNETDCLVITNINEKKVLNSIRHTTIRNIIVSVIVVIFAVFFMIYFSRSISLPIKILRDAAAQIETGDYNLNIPVKTNDEIGELTQSFIRMWRGIENFEKFTDKALVSLMRNNKLSAIGKSRMVSIAFIFIRNFDQITRSMNAKKKVEFVNSYLSRVVPCILKNNGLIDKYLTQEGLVVMALWGSTGGRVSSRRSAYDCVRSAIEIRMVNHEQNKKHPDHAIKIGCGINSGNVIAGQIGSDERMEWTVVGDAVNLAARFEGPNDLFDTDILVTENIMALVGDKFITEEMPALKIKGKKDVLRAFAVVNNKKSTGIQSIADVRKLWNG